MKNNKEIKENNLLEPEELLTVEEVEIEPEMPDVSEEPEDGNCDDTIYCPDDDEPDIPKEPDEIEKEN